MKYVKIFDSKMLPCGFVDIEGDMSAVSGKYVKVVGTDMQVKGVVKLGEDMTDAEKALLYQAFDANLMLVGVGSASDLNPSPSVTITCEPALPRDNYDSFVASFSRAVTINNFMTHVKVVLNGAGIDMETAVLSSEGGGQIGVRTQSDANVGVFRGDGSDVSYTFSDTSSGHGPYVYSMEWID